MIRDENRFQQRQQDSHPYLGDGHGPTVVVIHPITALTLVPITPSRKIARGSSDYAMELFKLYRFCNPVNGVGQLALLVQPDDAAHAIVGSKLEFFHLR